MQCASNETEPCTANAVCMMQFPWAEPVPACEKHVALAQQTMVNLGRENELRITALEEAAPATPRDAPVLQLVPPPATEAAAKTAPGGALELELRLEDARLRPEEARVRRLEHELHLCNRIEATLTMAESVVENLIAKGHELMAAAAAHIVAAATAPPSEAESVLEGPPPPEAVAPPPHAT